MISSGMLRRVVWEKLTNVSDRPDDGGSKNFWNTRQLLPDYTALYPRRQLSSYVLVALSTWNLTNFKPLY
jgi:hypothetical protein